ncbi:MAG: hypothetical protein ABSG31_03435 [Tepidisphaeraceae bacterium]
MTAEELADATKQFDKPIPLSKTRPLTPNEHLFFEFMRRDPSISICTVPIDSDLLRKATAAARKRDMTLGAFVSLGIQKILASDGQ